MADPAAAVPAANGADPHLNAVVEHLRAVAADMSRRVEMGSEDAAALLSEYDRRGTELVEAQRAKVSWSHSLRSQEIRVQQFRTERANLWKILGRPDGSGTSVELCDAVADERDARRRFQQDAAEREARLVAVRALAADAVAAWKAEGLNGEPCVGAVSIRAALGGTTDTPPPPAASEWELQMRGFLGKRVEVVLNEDPRKVVVGVLHGFDTDGQVRLVDEDGSWGWAWPCLDIAEAPAVSPREDETPEPARGREVSLSEALEISQQVLEENEARRIPESMTRNLGFYDGEEDALTPASTTPDPADRSERAYIASAMRDGAAHLKRLADKTSRSADRYNDSRAEPLNRVARHYYDAAERIRDAAAALAGTATTRSVAKPDAEGRYGLDDVLREAGIDPQLIGTHADPDFVAHQQHRHAVEGCGYCPTEGES